MPSSQILRETEYCPEPGRVLDGIFRECRRRAIEVLWVPYGGKRHPLASGEVMLRWMWQCLYHEKWAKPPAHRRSIQ